MSDAEELQISEEEEMMSEVGSFNVEPPSTWQEGLVDPKDIFLFKVSFKIEVIKGDILKTCEYQAEFLLLPTVTLKNKICQTVTFPSNRFQFFSIGNPKLSISAVRKGSIVGNAEIDFVDQFKELSQENEKRRGQYPIGISWNQRIIFDLDGEVIGETDLAVELSCLGPVEIADCEEVSSPEYDEYVADINGHTLNMRILRKPGEGGDDCECVCTCLGGGKNLIPTGGVAKSGSQIIFQMPTHRELCNKPPANTAMAYNVATCRKGKEHNHGNEKIKIQTGNTVSSEAPEADTFVLRLGKKSAINGTKGRLELELIAPKQLTPDDLKKPSSDKSVQTEAAEKRKAKKKDKKKK